MSRVLLQGPCVGRSLWQRKRHTSRRGCWGPAWYSTRCRCGHVPVTQPVENVIATRGQLTTCCDNPFAGCHFSEPWVEPIFPTGAFNGQEEAPVWPRS